MSRDDSSGIEVHSRQGISSYPWLALLETETGRDPSELLCSIYESVNDPHAFLADIQIERLCDYYSSVPPDQREVIRRSETGAQSLLHFAMRSAVMAMRHTDVSRIRVGLLALSVENFQFDPRDSVSALAMLRHAALKIGANWPNLIQDICSLSCEKVASNLRAFLARPPESITLEQFGKREDRDEHGPTIQRLPSLSVVTRRRPGTFPGYEPIIVSPGSDPGNAT